VSWGWLSVKKTGGKFGGLGVEGITLSNSVFVKFSSSNGLTAMKAMKSDILVVERCRCRTKYTAKQTSFIFRISRFTLHSTDFSAKIFCNLPIVNFLQYAFYHRPSGLGASVAYSSEVRLR